MKIVLRLLFTRIPKIYVKLQVSIQSLEMEKKAHDANNWACADNADNIKLV